MPSLNMTFVKRTKQWKLFPLAQFAESKVTILKKTIGTLSYSNLKLKYSNRMSFTEKSQVYKYLRNMQVASRVEETKKLSVNFLFSLFRGWNERTHCHLKFTFKCLSHDLSFDKERESLPKISFNQILIEPSLSSSKDYSGIIL